MASPTALTDKNLYAYCDNNPVIRIDEYGDMWELAVAGGGTMAVSSGFSLSALGGPVAAAVGAITPLGWVAIGTVVAITAVSVGIKYSKAKAEKGTKTRINSPIGRRNNYNSRKRAKEAAKKAAKKAGGGKEPIKHPKGFHGNKRPHYHPNVKNNYRLTPHGSSSHDHYFYPR